MNVAEAYFRTRLFRDWADACEHPETRVKSSCLTDAAEIMHDTLLAAARYHLDVVMLSASLRTPFRDILCREAVGETFAESLTAALGAGCRIRILLWNEPHQELIADSITRLLQRRAEDPNAPGDLQIRLSGTRERGADEVCHFFVAFPRPGADDPIPGVPRPWAVRLEEPHEYRSYSDKIDEQTAVTNAETVLATQEAREIGEPLLEAFTTLFDQIGMRGSQLPTAAAADARLDFDV